MSTTTSRTLPPRFHAGSLDTALASLRGFDDPPVTPTEAATLDARALRERAEAPSPLTQRQRAGLALLRIVDIDAALAELQAVVREAQNKPPDGASDGSIDMTTWLALAAIADALHVAAERIATIDGSDEGGAS